MELIVNLDDLGSMGIMFLTRPAWARLIWQWRWRKPLFNPARLRIS
jgi:hypothetical protein